MDTGNRRPVGGVGLGVGMVEECPPDAQEKGKGREMKKRVGRAMQAVQDTVARNEGQTMLAVAEAVGPHGSRMFGYAAVWRAVKAGLVVAKARDDKRGCYKLYLA